MAHPLVQPAQTPALNAALNLALVKSGKIVLSLAGLTAALMLGGCAQTSDLLSAANLAPEPAEQTAATEFGQTELQKATLYWGQEYAKKPSDLKAALSYGRNLKALGERQKALTVFQQASLLHDGDAELASEYGRLALDLDQVNIASRMLQLADNPTKPDWRVISARGTVFAKQGKFKDAIPFYEKALALSPNQPSVLNNLAMAQAMTGDAKSAEGLLRQASATDGSSPKVQQNLALVLGLQGRSEEAKALTGTNLASDAQTANADYMKRMVKAVPQKPNAVATPALASAPVQPFATTIAAAPAAPAMKPAPLATTIAAQALSPALTPAFRPATTEAPSAPTAWQTKVASTAPVAKAPSAGPLFKGSSN